MSMPRPATATSTASAERLPLGLPAEPDAILALRSAGPGDAARLAVLATQVWLHTYATDGIGDDIARHVLSELGVDRYAALLGDPRTSVLVAERGQRLVGMAVARGKAPCPAGAPSTVELQTLYVQAHFIGSGIGKRLLQAVEAQVLAAADCAPWLMVNARNDRALAFYRRQGYTQIGTDWFVLGETRHENLVLIGPGRGGR
ncbi:GNAT family N-acetyltransferase [Pseudorhodoferax soli]|uniref:Ribosomal protein S18 acetylase RimI-like enzyme n=1 Tax=Pseudorhodoferax soli TaxID=545864 RepID=A0A368Y044_9BURK|nr:GNAT family N-acetyltransferase [Pseudorhodoferax soli]RCW71624.1 ribosomal protein S18 acetylase RimI-like enzyme [Pseudorhodoferax soli]